MELLLTLLTWASALGSALIAGVFFAFSAFIMTALGNRPAAEGIAAMQEINVVVVRSGFIAVFVATAIASAILAVFALIRWDDPHSGYWLAGALLYVLGTFVLTIACNVPLNDQLAAADAASPQGASVWATYLTDWTWWNTVRTGASLAATAAFIQAIRVAPA
ncbi:anthrone oxygenase family protein [Hyphomicrobium sp. CS1GBMeth3]|uniref:anthrone oxygenase family protein n=1 Tax=Hyphomicrobium sp. CS1GBMeth3 TaxID=1892845 RepID=UPI000930BE6E|nr:anthrone oxygenase family protein [Hyphomicrobium sp. CS1GBMeth3]